MPWQRSALLPGLTGRAYLGGLDDDAGIEHSYCGLRYGKLNGRSLAEWSDADLTAFCHWYNVGWVVCRSPGAAERWSRFPIARPVARLKEGGQPVVVFVLDRPRSFVLSGSAKWEEATPRRIALSDVFNVVRDVAGVRKVGDGPDDFLLNGAREDVPIDVREFPALGEVTLLNGDTGLPL